MDFRSLRYFVAVYEEHSLSAASKRCFVAQPSISAAIQQLESELNCALFVRHSKGVTPTPEGTQLYPDARQVLSDIQMIKLQFQDKPECLSVRLGLMPFLSGKRIGNVIKALFREIPGLDLTLVDISEAADLRIISSSIVQPDEAFHKLWVDRYVLAMPKDHPLARHESVDLEQLNDLPFISRRRCDINDAWTFALQKRGIILNIKALVNTEEYALDMVAAGLGVSVVPKQSTGDRRDIVLKEFNGLQLERVVGLAYAQDKPLPPLLLSVIEKTPLELTK
ncbi:LysR family transcriptional regulator [Amphritea sp. 1_MG-2023]|uniref:LysR family transcriptional regulator n=1 Tax=Amphritea sp. 1_MG-2023 TaxID=3062670 RepID=UPI0026E45315|nr:LysR family transcriptional regulator [Amphritea sp. 1_MG-2023]MDO6564335.1 LysR family transcriptional regulator [Amphritea sp. 1_MG-2023]